MKRCPQCSALIRDQLQTCDLCGYSFVQTTVSVPPASAPASAPASPVPTDQRIIEYQHQYQLSSLTSACLWAIALVSIVHSVFFPSLSDIIMFAFFLFSIVMLGFYQAMLRMKMIEAGMTRDAVTQWEKEQKKNGCANMLLATAIALVICAFLAPMWYEQFKETVTFRYYYFR
ncbi:MAG: hypothetical protein NZ741_10175 [Armatimonadetes bacterium]|nr:hypothetical protein [Armatimonadota bacterium]